MTVQIRDAIWVFVGRLGALLGGVATLRVATEILGAAEMGKMFLVLSTISLVALVLAPAGLFFNRHIVEWHREGRLLENGRRFAKFLGIAGALAGGSVFALQFLLPPA